MKSYLITTGIVLRRIEKVRIRDQISELNSASLAEPSGSLVLKALHAMHRLRIMDSTVLKGVRNDVQSLGTANKEMSAV